MSTSLADPSGKPWRTEQHVDVAFLLLDGLRRPRGARSKDIVLCALGLTGDGTSHPLAIRAVVRESEQAWRGLLRDLKAEGIGPDLLLVCCDDHPALVKAIQEAFPDTPLQISVAHRLLALARKVEPQWRAACLAEARQIFSAVDLDRAVARFREWRAHWLKQGYRAVCSLEADLAACLTFYRFPSHLWSKIRTVNLVERAFRQARRDASPAGVDEVEPELVHPAGIMPDPVQVEEIAEEIQEAEVPTEVLGGDVVLAEDVRAPESPDDAAFAAVEESAALDWITNGHLRRRTTKHAPAASVLTLERMFRDDLVPAPMDVAVMSPWPAPSEPVEEAHPEGNGHQEPFLTQTVDLGKDADFMLWLRQYRRTQIRWPKYVAAAVSLGGLLTGVALALLR